MSDTTHDDDRPPLADRIRQAPTLEDAIREVLEDDSLAAPAKDRGRRVPTRAELDELEAMFRELAEQYPADRVSDFEVTFGMTAAHRREHHSEAYRHALPYGEARCPDDVPEGTSDTSSEPRRR